MKFGFLKNTLSMVCSVLALISCISKTDEFSIFPLTDNADLQISQLAIPTKQNVVSFIISKDKEHVLVYTFENEHENTQHPTVGGHLLVFDKNGNLEKDIPLNSNQNGGQYELIYTNTGLLTLCNGTFLYIIDDQSFSMKSLRIYRATDNIHLQEFEQKSKEEALQRKDTEMKQLNAAYNLNDEEIKVENTKIPADYWAKYREIKNQGETNMYNNQQKLYNEYVQGLIPENQPLHGMMNGNVKFLLLKEGGIESLYVVENDTNLQVQWTYLKMNDVTDHTGNGSQLNWKNNRIQDADNEMICLEKNKTSDYKDDLIGKMTTDYVIQLKMGSKSATFKMKDRPLYVGSDNFFSLKNGTAVVMYKNMIYLIQ
jgi:hypothetical protein